MSPKGVRWERGPPSRTPLENPEGEGGGGPRGDPVGVQDSCTRSAHEAQLGLMGTPGAGVLDPYGVQDSCTRSAQLGL